MNPIATRLVSSPTHSTAFAAIGLRTALLASCVIGAILPAATISTAQTSTKAVACVPNGLGACQLDPTGVSVEYRHSSGVHFTTACKNEQNAVEAVRNAQGQPEFVRTGQTLSLLPNPLAGVTLPINRYFITLGGVARHFYTLLPGELAVLDQTWATAKPNEACFESASVGNGVAPAGITSTTALPSAVELAAASCPRGTYPIWRAFNDARKTDNTTALPQHRFTSDWAQFQSILATTGANDKWADEGVRLCGNGADQQIKLTMSTPAAPAGAETRWAFAFTAQHDGKAADTPPATALVPIVAVRLPVGFAYQSATATNASITCTAAATTSSGQDVRCTLDTLNPGATSVRYTLWATGPTTATGTTRVSGIAIGASSANLTAELNARLAPAQCTADAKPSYGCAVTAYVAPVAANYGGLKFTTPTVADTQARAGETAITLTATLKNENPTGSTALAPKLGVEYRTATGSWDLLSSVTWNAPTSSTLTGFSAGTTLDLNVTVAYPAGAPRPAELRICAASNAFRVICTGNPDTDAASPAVSTSNLPTNDLPAALAIAGFTGPHTLAVGATYPAFSFTVSNGTGRATATGLSCSATTLPVPGILASPGCSMSTTSLAGGQSATCQCSGSGTTLTSGSSFSAWSLSVNGASGASMTATEYVAVTDTTPTPPPASSASLEPVVWDSASATSGGAQPSGVRLINFNGTLRNTSASAVPVTLKVQVLQNGTWIDIVSPNWSQPSTTPTNYSLSGSATTSGSFEFNPGADNTLTLRLCAVRPNTLVFGNNGGSCNDTSDITRKVSDAQVVTFTPPPPVTVSLTPPVQSLLVGQQSTAQATVSPNGGATVTGPVYLMLEAPSRYSITTSDTRCTALSTLVLRCQLLGNSQTMTTAQQVSFNLTPNVGTGGITGNLYASATALGTLSSAQCTGTDGCASRSVNPAYYDLRATINSVQSTQVTVAGTADATSSNFVLACDNIGNATTPASARCQVSIKNGGNVIGQTDFALATTQTVYIKNSGSGALALCKAQNTSGTVCDPVISNITPQAITSIELKATDVDGFDNNVANNNATASVTVGSAVPPPAPTSCTTDPNAVRLRLYQQGQPHPYRYDDIPLQSNTTYYLEIEPGNQAGIRRYLEMKTMTGSYSPAFSVSKCPGDLVQGADTPVVLVGGDAGYIAYYLGPPGVGAEIELPGVNTNTRWYVNYSTRQCFSTSCAISYQFSW